MKRSTVACLGVMISVLLQPTAVYAQPPQSGGAAPRTVASSAASQFGYTADAPVDLTPTDISTTGTLLATTSSNYTLTSQALPTAIPFFESTYNTVNIATQGYVTLSNGATGGFPSLSNYPIPMDSRPNTVVAPLWGEITAVLGGSGVYYQAYADRVVLQWEDISWVTQLAETMTFQVILYFNGDIQFVYLSLPDLTGHSMTVGIEDSYGADGMQVCHNAECETLLAANKMIAVNFPTTGRNATKLFSSAASRAFTGGSVLLPFHLVNTGNDAANFDCSVIIIPDTNFSALGATPQVSWIASDGTTMLSNLTTYTVSNLAVGAEFNGYLKVAVGGLTDSLWISLAGSMMDVQLSAGLQGFGTTKITLPMSAAVSLPISAVVSGPSNTTQYGFIPGRVETFTAWGLHVDAYGYAVSPAGIYQLAAWKDGARIHYRRMDVMQGSLTPDRAVNLSVIPGGETVSEIFPAVAGESSGGGAIFFLRMLTRNAYGTENSNLNLALVDKTGTVSSLVPVTSNTGYALSTDPGVMTYTNLSIITSAADDGSTIYWMTWIESYTTAGSQVVRDMFLARYQVGGSLETVRLTDSLASTLRYQDSSLSLVWVNSAWQVLLTYTEINPAVGEFVVHFLAFDAQQTLSSPPELANAVTVTGSNGSGVTAAQTLSGGDGSPTAGSLIIAWISWTDDTVQYAPFHHTGSAWAQDSAPLTVAAPDGHLSSIVSAAADGWGHVVLAFNDSIDQNTVYAAVIRGDAPLTSTPFELLSGSSALTISRGSFATLEYPLKTYLPAVLKN